MAVSQGLIFSQGAPAPQEPPVLAPYEENTAIFAPFPKRIRVGTREDGLLLMWEQSANVVDGYAVFRSESPIDQEALSKALRIADLPSGAHEYLDVPEKPGAYYYAVLGRTAEGGIYEVFIPLKNVSIAPVVFAPAAAAKPLEVKEQRLPEPPPIVRAESVQGGIRIQWSPVRTGRRVVLYRSPSSIRSLSDLLSASWVASAVESSDGIMDYPVPGIGYYYALVDDEGLRSGTPVLIEAQNVLKDPVSVPVGLYRIGLPEIPYASRSLPLPYLALTKGVESGAGAIPGGFSLPPPARLRPETEKTISVLKKRSAPRPAVSPSLTILQEDRESQTSGGEEYTLRLIVAQRLAKKDWKGASDELARYLSLNRSPAAAARAHFYRGQALAFSGLYRESFFEFLLAQDSYYVEANRWINWILDQIQSSETASLY